MAEEIRGYMAQLGYRNFDEMVGQVQHLEMNPEVLHYKSQVRERIVLMMTDSTGRCRRQWRSRRQERCTNTNHNNTNNKHQNRAWT
jgi:hypothetical protein